MVQCCYERPRMTSAATKSPGSPPMARHAGAIAAELGISARPRPPVTCAHWPPFRGHIALGHQARPMKRLPVWLPVWLPGPLEGVSYATVAERLGRDGDRLLSDTWRARACSPDRRTVAATCSRACSRREHDSLSEQRMWQRAREQRFTCLSELTALGERVEYGIWLERGSERLTSSFKCAALARTAARC